MPEEIRQYFATDREIYDLLMSGKLKLTETVLREIARSRGIFYSPQATRDGLAATIAILPHDLTSLNNLMHRRETQPRSEKMTYRTLDTSIDLDQLKEVLREYQDDVPQETVVPRRSGVGALSINLKYKEIDHSKTRLIQKQDKDADIEVVKLGEKTMIRMPATEKAESFFNIIVGSLESKTGTEIRSEGIELSGVLDPAARTKFFFDLIQSLPNYEFVTVTNLQVTRMPSRSQSNEDSSNVDADEDDGSSKNAEMLNAVQRVVLQGTKLELSSEYRSLRDRGYYIYGIKWHSDQKLEPHYRVQFEALFGNAEECTGFKYAALCSTQPKRDGQGYTFRQPKAGEKAHMFQVVEEAARKIISATVTGENSQQEAA